MTELDRGLEELVAKLYETILDNNAWGEAGRGKTCMEWYGNCEDHALIQKHKRGAS